MFSKKRRHHPNSLVSPSQHGQEQPTIGMKVCRLLPLTRWTLVRVPIWPDLRERIRVRSPRRAPCGSEPPVSRPSGRRRWASAWSWAWAWGCSVPPANAAGLLGRLGRTHARTSPPLANSEREWRAPCSPLAASARQTAAGNGNARGSAVRTRGGGGGGGGGPESKEG